MGICIQDNLNIRKLNYKTFCELIVVQCVKLSNIGKVSVLFNFEAIIFAEPLTKLSGANYGALAEKVKEDVLEGSMHKIEALKALNRTVPGANL